MEKAEIKKESKILSERNILNEYIHQYVKPDSKWSMNEAWVKRYL